MADLISQKSEEDCLDNKFNEPEIFKYFGIFKADDEQYQYFQDSLEESRKSYKAREIEL